MGILSLKEGDYMPLLVYAGYALVAAGTGILIIKVLTTVGLIPLGGF